MSKKLKRLSDWLSYNLRFKDLKFLTVSTIFIGILARGSNLKPLNPYPKLDQPSQTFISIRSKIFPLTSMGSFGMKYAHAMIQN
jgi:hypothetical protein